MKKAVAIKLAGTAQALADLLNITPSAVSQWPDDIPDSRVWQLKVIKPEWFAATESEGAPEIQAEQPAT